MAQYIYQRSVSSFVGAVSVTIWYFYLIPPPTLTEIATEQTPKLDLPDLPSIAVLPFVNVGGEAEQEYFSDGITDDLITDLSKISGLFVIARNSVFTYKGKPVIVQQVAKELGVRYVLEGSVRRAENHATNQCAANRRHHRPSFVGRAL